MGIREGNTTYQLQKSFQYKLGGQPMDATHIVLREPMSEHRHGFWVLSSHIMKAQVAAIKLAGDLKEAQDISGSESRTLHDSVDEIEKEASDKASEMTLKMLLLSSDINIEHFMDTFFKMVTKKSRKALAIVDGEESAPLNSVLIERMHPEDQLCLAVRWCSFFVMWEMSSQENTSSDAQGLHSQPKVV